ncbi:putative apicoplast dimethyladenosine synthase [Plasmodium gaboni]|uniref:rRNA adenine N(6)-methyltransferase n=1 Tax=Plasmodium gaboni TaxID=647221 RepID=A0A151LH36_9APIC|nr:putative apicoplast dimethyladenosine synthase [Plasmodium gaboni]KYN98280.1 putative apicoplast dimethyladenosine synthase [Plasmodium gaboni]
MYYCSIKLSCALFCFLVVTLLKTNYVLSKGITYKKNLKWYPQIINHYYINNVVFSYNKRRIATFLVCSSYNEKKKRKRNYEYNIKSELNVQGVNTAQIEEDKKGEVVNNNINDNNIYDNNINDNNINNNDCNNKGHNIQSFDDKNQLISRTFEGINIFPIKQNEKEEDYLKTKLPAREFKPKRSLGQNYLKDTNIIKKMISAIELNVDHQDFQNKKRMVVRKQEDKKTKKKKNKKYKKSGNVKHSDEMEEKQDIDNNVLNKQNIHDQPNRCDVYYKEEPQNNRIDKISTEQINDTNECNNHHNVEEEENINVENFESLQNDGNGVIELGCGLGQISKYLFCKYKNMTGIEIDSRALSVISRTMPGFDFIHDDVLQINYKELSINKKTKLTIIGNLPFYITSQILFCLLDFHKYIEQAIVTIQYEVGERIIARPNQKNYSILSILFNLYTNPYLLFKIPSKAFYPSPKVQAAVMKIIFKKNESYHKNINCNLLFLKQILKFSFQQRRKKLKTSLKNLLLQYNIPQLPEQFINLRPQQLYPHQFIELTNLLFPLQKYPFNPDIQTKVWRKKKHGD